MYLLGTIVGNIVLAAIVFFIAKSSTDSNSKAGIAAGTAVVIGLIIGEITTISAPGDSSGPAAVEVESSTFGDISIVIRNDSYQFTEAETESEEEPMENMFLPEPFEHKGYMADDGYTMFAVNRAPAEATGTNDIEELGSSYEYGLKEGGQEYEAEDITVGGEPGKVFYLEPVSLDDGGTSYEGLILFYHNGYGYMIDVFSITDGLETFVDELILNTTFE